MSCRVVCGAICTFGYIPDDLLAVDAADRRQLACFCRLLALLWGAVFTALLSFRIGSTRASTSSRCDAHQLTMVRRELSLGSVFTVSCGHGEIKGAPCAIRHVHVSPYFTGYLPPNVGIYAMRVAA